MDSIIEALHIAASHPPATRIDLDHLIARERRARQHRRVLASGALIVAVVVAAGAATLGVRFIGRHDPEGGPPGSPQPVGRCTAVDDRVPPSDPPATPDQPKFALPTEPTDAAVLRLSTVLNEALASALPGVTFVDVIHPNCAGIQFSAHHPPELYHADLDVFDAQGVAGSITIVVHYATTFGNIDAYPERQIRPDGTKFASWGVGGDDSVADSTHAFVVRPDGTEVRLMADNGLVGGGTSGRTGAPATPEQLVAIGTDPGLTLYP